VLIPLVLRRLEAPSPAPPAASSHEQEEQARVVAVLKQAFVQADDDFLSQLDPNVTVVRFLAFVCVLVF
jgi:hypothetical protein